jgi:AbiU2
VYEVEFWNDYELAREEVDKAIETFYTYLSIHKIAADNKEIYSAMNKNPTFWNINLYSLQTTFFITIGRIFDDGKDAFSIHKFIQSTLAHPEFFSKKFLAKRKSKGNSEPDWLNDYLKDVFEPGVSDLKIIKNQLTPYRKKFDDAYRDIRKSVFAHTLIKEKDSVSELFEKTNISEIKQILYTLKDMLEALWQLYHNGRKLEFGKTPKDYEKRIEKTTQAVLLEIIDKIDHKKGQSADSVPSP